MKKILITLSLLIIGFTSYSQEIEYIKNTMDDFLWIKKQENLYKTSTMHPLRYYKILFHIVRTSSGIIEREGLELDIKKAIKYMNNKYIGANVQFYSCGINYIDNDLYYNHDPGRDIILTHTYNDTTAINVYLCNSMYQYTSDTTIQYYWGYASGPSPSNKKNEVLIVLKQSQMDELVTLTHEFGHFFGLPHTHQNFIPEFADSSNCSTAGDLFCDTPADPNLEFDKYVDENCYYTGDTVDGHGDEYNPDVTLIMSYARHKCRTRFSNEQLGAINYWANRSMLICYSHMHTFENTTMTSNQNITEDVILIKNTNIENNAEVKLKSCAFVEISGDSEVKLGSTLDIIIE